VLTLGELILVGARRAPRFAAASGLLEPARELYMLDRATIQFEADCARHDPTLGYTLRPGSCRFSNTEFDVKVAVNSLGFRDDEASLDGPEIVVLGDSFAMGWGVAQNESFPELLEALSGRRVLNLGVSSYGTVRELRALAQVDLSRLRWLIIQFCNNDFFENRRYLERPGDFRVASREQYEDSRSDYLRMRRHVPGRYLGTLLARRLAPLLSWRPLAAGPPAPPEESLDPEDRVLQQLQVQSFLQVLEHSPVDLSSFQIIVFELNAYNRHFEYFTPMLAEAVRDPSLPPHLQHLRAVNLAAELRPEHGYLLDDHLRPSGHRLLAEKLLEIITRKP